MVDFNPIRVKLLSFSHGDRGKSSHDSISYAQFNNGYSHVLIDDGCYVIANGDNFVIPSSHLFPEAMEILKQLPSNPRVIQDRFRHVIYKDVEEYKQI